MPAMMTTLKSHCLAWCFILLSAASAQGQATRASLAGVVRDSTGLVLPGAAVSLTTSSAGAPVRTTASGADGTFAFLDVGAGTYRLLVTFPGFQPSEQDVKITDGAYRQLAVLLSLAGLQEQSSVEAVALPSSATMQTSVGRRLIDTLPSESLSAGLSSIVTLTTAGIVADSNGGFHPLGEMSETSFSVDNQPINDQQSRTFSNQLSQNAIESLEVITGVPGAEYGDKTSLIVRATTRSGLGIRRPTGSIAVGYGSFNTPTASVVVGAGSQQVGNFLAVDGLSGSRFLDTPEAEPLHAEGNVYNFFDRVDVRASARTGLQVKFSAARSGFQIPNTFDQEEAGQDQCQRQHSFNWAPSLTQTLGPRAVVELNTWLRRDDVQYDGSANPFDDQPAALAQHRSLTNAGAGASFSSATGPHTIKFGFQQRTTSLHERFSTGITDPTFNTPCFLSTGDPSDDTSLKNPAECVARGLVPNEDFLPGLLPYDLTRAGSLFNFDGNGRINQWAAYFQDSVNIGRASLIAGLRFDDYRGLSKATGLQPRIGAVYRFERSSTVLRASYGRIFLTPYNENLVLASSTGTEGFAGGVPGSSSGGTPLTPGRRHQYDVGIEQRLWRGVQVDTEAFWKFTDGAYDFDVILNTPLAFPLQFRQSTHRGLLVRMTLPEYRGWQAYTTLSHTRALLYGPELGGLRFGEEFASVARPDHDEPFQQNTHIEYRSGSRLGLWGGLTWRYDSGLVAVEVPTYSDALALTGDQQAAIGLYCGATAATRAQPLRVCDSPRFGATRINIPVPGTADQETNPPRITPRHLFDAAAGIDKVHLGSLHARLRVTAINLFDSVALYNFLSTFSGTHFVTPRSVQVQITITF